MVTLEKLEGRIESLTEKIKAISFAFSDAALSQEAEEAKEEAISALEKILELAEEDWETRPQQENNQQED